MGLDRVEWGWSLDIAPLPYWVAYLGKYLIQSYSEEVGGLVLIKLIRFKKDTQI